ncbi:patched domain-containing protein 3-like [Branchiostoma lanceolatum]|uniref:patched domain-containing protein 3-like n=1 Tax=Branchiostoma lanceolatum TaxID=7740 RepID=UPI0034512582
MGGYTQQYLGEYYRRYGLFLAGHPAAVLGVSLLLLAALLPGLAFLQVEEDVFYLFSPLHGRWKEEKAAVDRYFPSDDRAFDPTRVTSIPRGVAVMFEHLSGGSVLTEPAMGEVLRFHREAVALRANASGVAYTFGDLCAEHRGACLENPLLQTIGYHEKNIANLTVTFPLLSRPDGGIAFLGGTLGELEFQAGEMNVVSGAKMFSNTYFLRSRDPEDDLRSKLWLRAFMDMVDGFESDVVRVLALTDGWLKDATEGKVAEAKQLVVVGLSLLSAFCMLACVRRGEGWRDTWRRSSPLLGLAGVLSGGFAALSSGGLLGYCGIKLSDITYLAPALVLGVGVDDMFIMLAAWRRTDPADGLEYRAGQTLSEAASTITITSLTNALAFGLGSLSDFPYTRTFCAYTAVAMVFDYIYQVTFFSALLVFSGRMEYPASTSSCCHNNLPYSKLQNGGGSVNVVNNLVPSISDGVDECDASFPEVLLEDKQERRKKPWRDRTPSMSTIAELDPECEDAQSLKDAEKSLGRRLGRAITNRQTLVWLACAYCTYLLVAGAGIASLDVRGLSIADWMDTKSMIYMASERDRKYFADFYPTVTMVMEGDVDYWNVTTQASILGMLGRMEELDHMNGGVATQTWLRHFISFLKLSRGSSDLGKEEFLRILKEEFLSIRLFGKYKRDVVFSPSGTDIVASRFILVGKGIKGKAIEIATLSQNLRDIVDDCPFRASVFSYSFPMYEQFSCVKETLVKNVVTTLVSIILVTLLFVPKPVYSLWIVLCILSIDVGVLGFMSLWGIALGPISVAIFTVSIGLSVDYAAHVTVHFAVSESEGRREKAIRALCEVQLPVFLGASSTALSILPACTGSTYVFTLLFKVMILVIVIGCAHGLVLLPAALSVLGPAGKVKDMPSV